MDIVERLLKDISPLRDLKSTERNKLHRDAADEIEQLREENQRQKEKIMLLNSIIQTEHEIIRVTTRKESE